MQVSAEAIAALLPSLRRYARALVRDPAHADDLVQDCVERALGRRHLWRPSGELRSWLFTIMHNLHVNEARAAARRGHFVHLPGAYPSGAGEPATPAPQLHRVEAQQIIGRLAALPPDQRAALLLVVLEGMSYEEVAGVQGVPVGTVMSRLSRARATLRAADGEAGGGNGGGNGGHDGDRERTVLRRVK